MVLYRVFSNEHPTSSWYASEEEARANATQIRGRVEALTFSGPIDASVLVEILRLGASFPRNAPASLLSSEVIYEFPKADFLLPTGPAG
nr:hypothetical protein [Gammaproteobacteria bacterium]